MDVLLAHQRAVEDDSKYIRSSFHGLDPHLRSVLEATLACQPPDGSSAGPRALIVCPTRASIDERLEALDRCARNRFDPAGSAFPISFSACASQEPQATHDRLGQHAPVLLLTDAASLDRWLMGWSGPELRDSLRVVAFEAKGQGRVQAVELALLISRLQVQCEHALVRIGNVPSAAPVPPELLQAHLYALAVAEMDLPEWSRREHGRPALSAFVNEAPASLPLRAALRAALQPRPRVRARLQAAFVHTLRELQSPLHAYTDARTEAWIEHALDTLPGRLDQALGRWRVLYRAARATLEWATYKIQSDLLPSRSGAYRCQQRRQEEGAHQLQLLRNACDAAGAWPEFHPARFLAAEGLLPGHGEARHPLRVFLSAARGPGEFISRPHPDALRELGPRALLHHGGRRYRVTGTVPRDAAAALTEAKLCRSSGCLLLGDQRRRELCPVSGANLSDPGASEYLHDLLEAPDAYAEEVEGHAPADEPGTAGFDVDTCFSIDEGSRDLVQEAWLRSGSETLLALKFIPGARLVRLNRRWHGCEDEGFMLDLHSGAWCGLQPQASLTGPRRRVRLWTSYRTDALLLQPTALLGLKRGHVAAFQHALLHGVARCLQLDPGELGMVCLGQGEVPSILLHEVDGGGAALLSRLMDEEFLRAVMSEARAPCRVDKADCAASGRPAGGAGDGGWELNDVLDRLGHCALDLKAPTAEEGYEARYLRLLQQLDPASAASRRFLDHLHGCRLRLPDAVRRRVPGLYLQPDFHFEPRTWVFCDGASPGDLAAQEEAWAQHETLLARGDEVWVWHAAEDLAAKVAQRPDLFSPQR
ncbi:DUF1998 domain-containing protein [uncultured Azohydromonas sp.]|jgi:Domain of unknown function (DUF1998).|uniref:DUF1998 domain-containing protein n=1 Tax=uncultured Azohydromonas sp. TaxID=487342 RepID=UPI00261E3962|nr:DUF1998 domain-containing protein [uncultured Azohydromonas sp.]